jgi:hypothetical protein
VKHFARRLLLRFRELKTTVKNCLWPTCGLAVLHYRTFHGSMLRAPAFITVIIVLSACATPYQKVGYTGGYTDFETQPGIYYVSFKGNAYTSKETVIYYWHQRAAEICGGQEHYEVLSQESSVTPYISGGSKGVNTVYKARAEGYIRCKQTAVPASAEGEYLMWSKMIPAEGDILWDASNTFPSYLTCQTAAEKASAMFEELVNSQPEKIKQLLGRGKKIQNVRRIGTTVLFEVDGELISAGYTCLPATIDPRKKK